MKVELSVGEFPSLGGDREYLSIYNPAFRNDAKLFVRADITHKNNTVRENCVIGSPVMLPRYDGENITFCATPFDTIDLKDFNITESGRLSLLGEGWFPTPYYATVMNAEFAQGRIDLGETFVEPIDEYDKYGCEDARFCSIGDLSVVTYNGVGTWGNTVILSMLAKDGTRQRRFAIFGPENKHVCIFPEMVGDRYYCLVRPLSRIGVRDVGVWLFSSLDLQSWAVCKPYLMPRTGLWDGVRVGPAAPPIVFEDSWLISYYGVDASGRYSLGIARANRSPPFDILERSSLPILEPSLEWEKHGRRPNTVFSCGAKMDAGGLQIIYGAGDARIGLLSVPSDEIYSTLDKADSA